MSTDNGELAHLTRPHFPHGKLYGRTPYVSAILDVCNRINTSSPPEMVLVSGCSGTGKSALVDTAMDLVKEKGFQLVSGKFDLLQQAEPLSAIIAAFNTYCYDLSASDTANLCDTAAAIQKALGSDCGVLTKVFPSLCNIIGEPVGDLLQVGSLEAQNRFNYIFRVFIRTIATPSNPIILFLDDLQWGDTSSLNLIKNLLTDTELKSFLFVGSYRDNEVSGAHPLAMQLQEIERTHVNVSKIRLGNISKEDVNAMISDTLSTPQLATMPLADIIYQKTKGNVLFVIRFIHSLYDEGLLQFSSDTKKWKWSTREIGEKVIPDDVTKLFVEKILQLPSMAQDVLKLFSCFGSSCDKFTLQLVLSQGIGKQEEKETTREELKLDTNEYFAALDLCVDEGLLRKELTSYSFIHDQVQFASYSLIPKYERSLMHLNIGNAIWNNAERDEDNEFIFLAVDQLNRGKSLIRDEEGRLELSRLNLRAGQKAISLSTFSSSALYFKTGVELLGEDGWERHYTMSLHLQSYYAEAEYCNGNFREVGKVTSIILRMAESFDDKLRAYKTLVRALGAQGKTHDALDIGLNVLAQLGEQYPSPFPEESILMRSLMQIKQTFEDMTDDEFSSLKTMDDSNKLVAMHFLGDLLMFVQVGEQRYVFFIVSQMMRLSLSHGLCKQSATAFSSCSFQLCGPLGDYKGAHRMGQFALNLTERFQEHEYVPPVYANVYGGIFGWTKSMKMNLEPLLEGYTLGMRTGNIEYSFLNSSMYLVQSFACGAKLGTLYSEIKVFSEQAIEYKQETLKHVFFSLGQMVLNLTGKSDNPSQLNGDALDFKIALADCVEKKTYMVMAEIYGYSCAVAYMFGEYEQAGELIEKRLDTEKLVLRKLEAYGFHAYFFGLISFMLARKTKEDKWMTRAYEAMAKVRAFSKIGPSNHKHKLLLFEAESSFMLGDFDDATIKYDLAIAAACTNEFVHEEAIANERAGDFFAAQGNYRASHYYSQAHKLYLKWGAHGKAVYLQRSIAL